MIQIKYYLMPHRLKHALHVSIKLKKQRTLITQKLTHVQAREIWDQNP